MTKSEIIEECEGLIAELSAEGTEVVLRVATVLARKCKTAEKILTDFLQEANAAEPGSLPMSRFVSLADAMEEAANHEAGRGKA